MDLEFDRKDKDSRGGFILATYGGKKISLFEIKKGQARVSTGHKCRQKRRKIQTLEPLQGLS